MAPSPRTSFFGIVRPTANETIGNDSTSGQVMHGRLQDFLRIRPNILYSPPLNVKRPGQLTAGPLLNDGLVQRLVGGHDDELRRPRALRARINDEVG